MGNGKSFTSQGPMDGETFQKKDADPIEESPDETLADDPTDFGNDEVVSETEEDEKVSDEERVVGRRNEDLAIEAPKPL